MNGAAQPADEEERLAVLSSLEVLDTPPEDAFDRLALLAAQLCQTPISLVTLVDRNRQWFKAGVGLNLRETTRDLSFCAHAILRGEAMVVPDTLHDARFVHNQLVLSAPHIRFYAGVPVEVDSHRVGTLCVIDVVPRRFEPDQRTALETLAREVETQFRLRQTVKALRAREEEKEALMSMMAHDMRGPLTVCLSVPELLMARSPSQKSTESLCAMQAAAHALQRMVDDGLDVVRSSELCPRVSEVQLASCFEHLVSGQSTAPDDKSLPVVLDLALETPTFRTDADWLSRICWNLVANAQKYSSEGPIRVQVRASTHSLRVEVQDRGPGVPEAEQERIFERGYRLSATSERPGHGLGLAFCKRAAEALSGQVGVYNDRQADGTVLGAVFWVELPPG